MDTALFCSLSNFQLSINQTNFNQLRKPTIYRPLSALALSLFILPP